MASITNDMVTTSLEPTTEPWLENIDVDIHYFISLPEATPLHSRFDKSSTVTLRKPTRPGDTARILFASYTTNICTLEGNIDLMTLEYDEDHENLVHVELDYGDDYGASLGEDWMIEAYDAHNEEKQPWRPFCLDLYFWKRSGAEVFMRQMIALQEAAESEPEPAQAIVPSLIDPTTNSLSQVEVCSMNLLAISCLDLGNSELNASEQTSLKCSIWRTKDSNELSIRVNMLEKSGNKVTIVYKLTSRTFPYQLPDFTVQVRFLDGEKWVQSDERSSLMEDIRAGNLLDSPTLRFEDFKEATRFQETLRGETMVFSCVVRWLRCTSNAITTANTGNFTSVDERRLHFWQTTDGRTKVVFHRQFHLVTAFITRSAVAALEPGTSNVRVAGLKINIVEGLPAVEAKLTPDTEGIDVSLKFQFPDQEVASKFVAAVSRYRDTTATNYHDQEDEPVSPQDPLESMMRPQKPNAGLGLSTIASHAISHPNTDVYEVPPTPTFAAPQQRFLPPANQQQTPPTPGFSPPSHRFPPISNQHDVPPTPGFPPMHQRFPSLSSGQHEPPPTPGLPPPQQRAPPAMNQQNAPPTPGFAPPRLGFPTPPQNHFNTPPTPGFAPPNHDFPRPGLQSNMSHSGAQQHLQHAPSASPQPQQQTYIPQPPGPPGNTFSSPNFSQQGQPSSLSQHNVPPPPMLFRSQTMPVPQLAPIQTGARRQPPPVLQQFPPRSQFVQAPLDSPRFASFDSPQSPMSATFQTLPFSSIASAQPTPFPSMTFQGPPQQATTVPLNPMTRSPSNANAPMARSPSFSQMARSPSNNQTTLTQSPVKNVVGAGSYFPHSNTLPNLTTTPGAPNAPPSQLSRTRSPSVGTKYPLHTRQNSTLGVEVPSTVEADKSGVVSVRSIDSPDLPSNKGRTKVHIPPPPPPEDLEPINPALGGNVPVSPNSKAQNSSMSKMFRKLR